MTSLLTPFKIGIVPVDPPLVLAPMAGLTDVTFRRVVRSAGPVGLVVSEIVSAEGLTRGNMEAGDFLAIGPGEHPISLQISGSNPATMAEAARICEQQGADIVDINMGCPVPKVTKGFCGAALMRDPSRAAAVAEAVVKAVKIPVTAKMRLGWNERQLTFIEVAKLLEEAGVSGLCLHARTREQGYKGKAAWFRIAELKSAVKLPVIGNGDVESPHDVFRMFAETGCDGVMIGRVAVKNPWIFRQAAELAETGTFRAPSVDERIALIRCHFGEIIATSRQGLALHRMKTFLGKYTRGLEGASALRLAINESKTEAAMADAFEAWASSVQPAAPGQDRQEIPGRPGPAV